MKKVILLLCLMPVLAFSQISQVRPGDVVISEIMADPLPPVLLPDQEYLEIFNRSDRNISLEGWKLISGDNKTTLFPVSDIGTGEFAILCSITDTGLFSGYGKVIGLKSFPILTDGGKSLILADNKGMMVHFVEYSSEWYDDDLRSGGGWSLEMIDTGYPFYAEGNWKASVSRSGGTPGRSNSVSASNPDLTFRGLLNIFPSDSNNIEVIFSEPLRDPDKLSYMLTISGEQIGSVIMKSPSGKDFSIIPESPFRKGIIYSFKVSSDISDHAGNKPDVYESEFGLPEPPVKDDILFNELLFNPLPGDADYIELYNNSLKPLDASWLYISAKDDATGKTTGPVPVSEKNILIMPGRYFAFTTDRPATVNRYFAGDENRILETGSLPSMNDDEGHLILMDRQLAVCDEVKYDEDMHFSLLSETEGISLEKVSPKGNSLDRNNWHSASGSSGWGTPGAVNSVYTEMPVTDSGLQFSSTRITPDNNGIEDVLTIKLDLSGTGNVITLLIFDENGTRVRKLTENLLSGPETYLTWDGTDDSGTLLPSGIYILLISFFDDSGNTGKWKRVCTIIRQ